MKLSDTDIDALIERFPLPEDVPDVTLNKAELAKFFSVSLPTVEAWIADGLPVLTEGTNGRAWEFRAAACWAFRQAKRESEALRQSEAERAIQAMRLHLVGGSAGDKIEALPPRERQLIYAVQREHEQLSRERGSLIPRDDVRQGLDDYNSEVRTVLVSLSDRLEREAGLKGKTLELVNAIADDLLDSLSARIQRFFDDRPLVTRRDRADLFNQ